MEAWLEAIATGMNLIVQGIALLVTAIGTLQAFISGLRVLLFPSATDQERRMVWVRFARWLVAALTFQLAADLIAASVVPTWDAIGKLAAVAVIRTFLSYFLERDLFEATHQRLEKPNLQ